MKTVTCESGIRGWQSHLQESYSSFEEFESYSEMYGLHKRLGFKTAQAAWKKNPVVQGSVIPTDYKMVNQ